MNRLWSHSQLENYPLRPSLHIGLMDDDCRDFLCRAKRARTRVEALGRQPVRSTACAWRRADAAANAALSPTVWPE